MPSTCVIIDCMERILLNCIDIRSKETGSYESFWSITSIISIYSKPYDQTKIIHWEGMDPKEFGSSFLIVKSGGFLLLLDDK